MSGTAGKLVAELSTSGVAQVDADFARLEGRLGTLAGAQRKYEQDVALVQRTMEKNPALIERGTQALDALHSNFQRGTTSASGFSNAVGELGGSLTSMAGRLGPAGSALSAFGPAGLAAAAGLGALSVGLVQVAKAGDDMVASLGRINSATGSMEQTAVVYDRLYKLSLQTGQAVSEGVTQFQRFSIATKEVGATNDQAIRLVETMQKAAIVGGASGQEAAAGALQLGQALASGVLQGDELRSLLENMPNLAVALARELGVGVGELRKMGSEGKLTADTVLPALLRAGEAINAEYEKMPVTMARAFDQMTVASSNFLARMDQAIGLSQRLAQGLAAAARALDGATVRAFPSAPDAEAARTSDLSGRADYLRSRIRAVEAPGPSLTAPTGGYARRAQIVGNRNAGGDLAADMREELAQVEKQLQESNAARLALLREGREDEQAEAADAAAKRLENQRRQSETQLTALRTSLDKDFATRQAWEKRVKEINALIDRPGGVSAVEGQRLIALATTERDEALKKLDGTAKRDAEARTAESKARREALKAEKEAAAETLKIYDQLRISSRSELLLGTDGDARSEQAILTKIRGTALDPDVQKRAREKIERDQKSSQEKQERLIERSTDSVVEYSADRFADLFNKNGAGWAGMLETFESTAKSTFARIAAEAIIRPIVTPIVTSLMGGAAAVAGSTGAPGATPGSVAGATGLSTMDAAKLLGKTFTGGEGGLYKTGFASVDGVINSQAYSGLNGSSVSYGQAATGALGVAGGAYGIYQGFQTGGAKGIAQGVGGAASMAGGAAALAGGAGASAALGAIAVAAPYVALAALAASYFLDGQKPSDKTGVYRGNLQTGLSNVGGLTGDRFSQENRDLASNLGKSVSDMAASLRGALGVSQTPFNFEIAAGARDGLIGSYGGRERSYKNDEAGAKQLIAEMTAAIIESMKGMASVEVQSVINASGGNVETTLANLDFYNGQYKELSKPLEQARTGLENFEAGLVSLTAQWAAAISKAQELGLATDGLAKRQQEAIDAARAEVAKGYDQSMWQSQGRGYIQGLRDIRENYETNSSLYRSVGRNPEDLYNSQARAALGQLTEAQLQDIAQSFVGWDDAMAVLAREVLANTKATVDSTAATEAAQRAAMNVRSTNYSLWDRIQNANGDAESLGGRLQIFDRRAEIERANAARDGATDVLLLERTFAEERLAIERDFNRQAADLAQQRVETALNAELTGLQRLKAEAGTLQSFLGDQAIGGAGVSPQQAFQAAQAQFQEALTAARNGGDLGSYTSAANNLLNANSNFNATGEQAAMMREMVLSTTRSLGASLNLPGFTDNLAAGLERVMVPNTDAVTTLTRSVDDLKEEFRTYRVRAGAR
jgi:tape measure domain-containing protein